MRLRADRFEVYLILASVIWGTSFVANKIGVEQVDPFYFSILRFLIATPALMFVAYLFSDFDLRIFRDKVIWFLGALNASGLCLQNVGMTTTTATNSVLLIDINVIFVAIIASLVLKETITRFTVLGLTIGLVGVSIVSTGGDLGRLFDGSLTGNLLVFMAGIVWAFYIVYQKKSLAKYPDVIMMTSALAMTTTVACLPMSLLFANSYFLPMEGLLTAAYLGLVCTGGAFLLYMAGLKGKGATESTIILLLEIVFAMLFAFLLLREVPTLFTAAGGAMIVAAIVLVSLYENNGKRNREA